MIFAVTQAQFNWFDAIVLSFLALVVLLGMRR